MLNLAKPYLQIRTSSKHTKDHSVKNVSKILYLLLQEEEGKEHTGKLNSAKHTLKIIG
jgi:hypothetical protein